MAPKKSPRPSARDRILAAASQLFYQEGVQNVGIDRIIAESGVAKMSLYNHFKSKDALIAAYLQQRDETWGKQFQEKVEGLATEPREQLLVIFDVLQDWFKEPAFRGCAFMNAAIELADREHPGTQVSLRHHQLIYDYILDRVRAAEFPHPEELAQQLMILVDGAIMVAFMDQQPEAAQRAKQAASALIAATSISAASISATSTTATSTLQ